MTIKRFRFDWRYHGLTAEVKSSTLAQSSDTQPAPPVLEIQHATRYAGGT
jgi:hypothetical protein